MSSPRARGRTGAFRVGHPRQQRSHPQGRGPGRLSRAAADAEWCVATEMRTPSGIYCTGAAKSVTNAA
eukprot:2947853-Pyramimonas_sp.AAC.1